MKIELMQDLESKLTKRLVDDVEEGDSRTILNLVTAVAILHDKQRAAFIDMKEEAF